jgi:hypothetical protein
MDNQFYLHMRQRKGASADSTVLLAFLLAECSAANGKSFKLRPAFAAELLGRPEKRIRQALLELEVLADCVSKPLEAASSQTDGQDGRTDGQDGVTSAPPSRQPKDLPPLAVIWNEHRGDLPQVRGCSGKRLEAAQDRWADHPEPSYWTEIVQRMAKSDFCLGKKPSPGHEGWKADFDFLIRPNTQHKVLEGKYDNRKPASTSPKLKGMDELSALSREAGNA